MKTRLPILIVFFFAFAGSYSQVPGGFNYQAIARDVSNNPITIPIGVRFTIRSDSITGTVFWVEEHNSVTPNDDGVFNVVIGKGARISGLAKFSDIDWTVTPKYVMTEINYGGWKLLGSSKLWTVPYAMVADSIGAPFKKLLVAGVTANMEEPLFEVKNAAGMTVFAVYSEGVRIYVGDGNTNSKGVKGGFAVSSMADSKTEAPNYLYVSKDSIRAYVFDDPAGKAVKGGFAVSGFNNAKMQTNDYLLVSPDSVRVFIDKAPDTKAPKGGFAVSGFGTAKGYDEEYLRVTRDSTRIYVNEDPAKAVKGGFAVGSFADAKAGETTPFTSLTPENYFIGHRSGISNLTGIHNSFVGYETGIINKSGRKNVFLGYRAGYSNDTASYNVFIGNEAGNDNRYGRFNTFLGYQSGHDNDADFNVFLGYQSGFTNSTGKSNTFLGHVAGYLNSTGNNNVFLGDSAGFNNVDGDQNIFLGNGSGKENSGDYNAFIGFQSGRHNSTGQNNAFIGYQAGYNNLTANNNAFIGYQSGWKTWKGGKNVFIGYQAGYSNVGSVEGPTQPGNNNIYVGDQAAMYNTTGRSNVYIGHNAGYGLNPINTVSPPRFNVYIGYQSGYKEYSGRNNTFIGYQAGYTNYSGNWNTFIGDQSGYSNNSGIYNTFIGFQAGYSHTSGDFNLFLGNEAGRQNLTGASNIFLGYRAGYYETLSNKLFIDNMDRTSEATSRTNALIYGEFNSTVASQVLRINGKVGIMLAANPTEALEVNGNVKATTFIATLSGAGAYKYNTSSNMIIPDYVFDFYFDRSSKYNPEYKTPSLVDLEDFIKVNRHLPGVPSRSEIEKTGAINLQAFSMVTLEKLEENTLYILGLEDGRKKLESEVKNQKAEIETLKRLNEENYSRIRKLEENLNRITASLSGTTSTSEDK